MRRKIGKCLGLIVAESTPIQGSRNLVYVLQTPEGYKLLQNKIVQVAEQAFNVTTLFDQLQFQDDVAAAKNKQRHLDKPLLFGDFIEWDVSEIQDFVIFNFSRCKTLHQCKLEDGKFQIRLPGVRNPFTATFWSELFTTTFDLAKLGTVVEPDVCVYAWIELKVLGDEEKGYFIESNVVSFDSFDISSQHFVGSAPWNASQDVNPFACLPAKPCPSYEDFVIAVEPPQNKLPEPSEWRENIKNRIGLLIEDRLIMCHDLPQYDFVLPIRKVAYFYEDKNEQKIPMYFAIGEYVYFDAIWSSFHKKYFVLRLRYATDYQLHHAVDTELILSVQLIPANIGEEPAYGFYTEQFGVLPHMDDPNGVLDLLADSPVADRTIKVATRCLPVAQRKIQRFSILSIFLGHEDVENSTKSYYKWKEETQINLGAVEGIVISNEGDVFAPKYPGTTFRGNFQPNKLVPSTRIRFRAEKSANTFQIKHWEIISAHGIVTSAFRHMDENDVEQKLLLLVEAVPALEYEGILKSEAVGFIDTMEKIKGALREDRRYEVWVMRSPMTGDIRKSRCAFEVVSTTRAVPKGVHPRRTGSAYSHSGSRSGTSQSSSSSLSSRMSGRSRFSVGGHSSNNENSSTVAGSSSRF